MSEYSALGDANVGVTEREARLAALARMIDGAEREAASLGAQECAICLQLARVALQTRRIGEADRT